MKQQSLHRHTFGRDKVSLKRHRRQGRRGSSMAVRDFGLGRCGARPIFFFAASLLTARPRAPKR